MSKCKDCSHREVCFFRVQAGGDLIHCPLFTITDNMVEVVRCKDCVHFDIISGTCNYFGYYTYSPDVDEDDFCSHGERKEENER